MELSTTSKATASRSSFILSRQYMATLPTEQQAVLNMLFAGEVQTAKMLFASVVLGLDVKDEKYYSSKKFRKEQEDFLRNVGLYCVITEEFKGITDYGTLRLMLIPILVTGLCYWFEEFNDFSFPLGCHSFTIFARDTIKDYAEHIDKIINFPVPLFNERTMKLCTTKKLESPEVINATARLYKYTTNRGAIWQPNSFSEESTDELNLELVKQAAEKL
jgi:hypothetical protein